MIRRLAALLVAAVVLAMAGPAAADPAIEQLRQGSVYVSPAVGGASTADAVARLSAVADELRAAGRPVRIAVVKGPSGAASMRDYALRVRNALGFEGMVVVVAPGRAVGSAGPRSQAAVTNSLRTARVGTIADPVEQAAAAARAAAGPPLAPSNSDLVRSVLALIGIAMVGGIWAAAFGIRRASRRAREALDDRSARARVKLDAVGARLDILAEMPEHHARADDRLDAAMRMARRAQADLDQATDPDAIPGAEADVDRAFELLRQAERAAAVNAPPDPFEGLCRVDPAHGRAVGRSALAEGEAPIDMCSACMKRVRENNPPPRRMVPTPEGDVPFDSE